MILRTIYRGVGGFTGCPCCGPKKVPSAWARLMRRKRRRQERRALRRESES